MRRAALLLPLLIAGCGGDDAAPTTTPPPQPAREHFGQAAETTAPQPHGRYLIARLRAPTWLRDAPGGRRIRRVKPRTEFGSPQVLAVTRRRDGWLEVISARLPNRRRGWIREARARLAGTDVSLRIDRSARRLTLRRGERILRTAAIAVGRPGNETPLGRFAVTDKLRPSDPASPYGCCAIALSGHQSKLVAGWPGGDRLAIHGTPATWSIGKAVSLGCLRARAEDLKALLERVPLGAPVFIRA